MVLDDNNSQIGMYIGPDETEWQIKFIFWTGAEI